MCKIPEFTEEEKRKLFDPSINGLDKSTKEKFDTLFENTVKFERRPKKYDSSKYKQYRWGKIPSGGKDASKLAHEFGYTTKGGNSSLIKISLEERINGCSHNEDMIYCHWCACIGLDPIHPRSKVSGPYEKESYPYECFSMRQYKNSLRTPEQFETSYDSEFLEWLMRKVRLELGEKKILTENEIRKYTFNLYDNRCVCCGVCGTKEKLQGDHIKPRSLFWSLTIHNCIPLCSKCNGKKLATSPDKFFVSDVLIKISQISKIPLDELQNVGYNYNMVNWLVSNEDIVNEWVNQRGKKEEYKYILENMITKAEQKRSQSVFIL